MKKAIVFCLMICLLIGCQTTKTESKLILTVEGNKVEVAPEYYDADAWESFTEEIVWMELAKDVEFYETIQKTIIHENGKETTSKTTSKITKETFENIVEQGNAYVYLKINANLEIEKVTLWGTLVIYE